MAAVEVTVSQHMVCELLTFFVLHHGYRIKYFVLRNNIVGKVCDLMGHTQKYIALAAVRFMRACVGLKDEFYFRYMIKNDSFLSLVQLFKRNEHKYNLINSAIIELFDFIRKENIKSLLAYITDKFAKELRCVTYVDTFNGIWALQDKNAEFNQAARTVVAEVSAQPDNDIHDQEAEDAYFSTEEPSTLSSTDDDIVFSEGATAPAVVSTAPTAMDMSTSPPSPSSLVPYGDDMS